MLKTAISHSIELDTGDAIEEVLNQSQEQLGDLKPQAGLLFAGNNHNHPLILNRINEIYPEIELIGGTSEGEISSMHGFAEDSIALILFYTDRLQFKAGVIREISEITTTKIKNTIEATKSGMKHEPELCIMTPCLSFMAGNEMKLNNLNHLLEGIGGALGPEFPIFGGCTANLNWEGDLQFYKLQVYSDSAPFLLISGPLIFSSGVSSGWIPIGKKTTITKAENNTVFKIGDQSAFDFYKHYLGEITPIGLVEYPLAVLENDGKSYHLRGSLSYNEKKGCISLADNIPEGTSVQLTHVTRNNLLEAVKKSVEPAIKEYPGSDPSIALCFSCAARKFVLGTRVEEEYRILNDIFPDIPVAGFYTGGEIGPFSRGNPVRLHNYTFVSLLMGLE